jgi:diguanylate cyclase (GGDEF)-like protein
MNSPVRSRTVRTVARAPAEPPQPRGPQPVESTEPAAALEYALSITTAPTEDRLLTRTVEAAGRLTRATVACAVSLGGAGYTWGEPQLADKLLTAMSATPSQPGLAERHDLTARGGFGHLGMPDALTADLDGTPLVVASAEAEWFGPPAQRLLDLVVAHAAAGRDRLRELALMARRADCDPLTGLRHYRPFEERLAASVPGRTAVIAIDVDNFKQINDRYGHQAGDAALVAIVGSLSRALRGDDHIYRIGGDEFAVVIDVAASAEVTAISRRLLRAARSVGYPISVGAALRSPHESGRETLLRADRALYQAKRAGRNTARLAA